MTNEEQCVELIERLPIEESTKAELIDRVESQGLTESLLDHIEQLVADAQLEAVTDVAVAAAQVELVETYKQRVEQVIEEARQELQRIDAAEDLALDQFEDLADRLEAQDAVDNA